jgi:hypothetical protein
LAAGIEDGLWVAMPASDIADSTLVKMVSLQAARVELAHRHLDAMGLTDASGNPRGVEAEAKVEIADGPRLLMDRLCGLGESEPQLRKRDAG